MSLFANYEGLFDGHLRYVHKTNSIFLKEGEYIKPNPVCGKVKT